LLCYRFKVGTAVYAYIIKRGAGAIYKLSCSIIYSLVLKYLLVQECSQLMSCIIALTGLIYLLVYPAAPVHIGCTEVVSYQENLQLAVVIDHGLPVNPVAADNNYPYKHPHDTLK